ncbi:hypothetical protein ACLKA7_011904 [Drosophila subpalustris]
MSILPNTIRIHNTSYQYQSKPRNMNYPISDTAILTNYTSSSSRSTSSIAVHNSFTINLVHRRTQQLHDQPRPSPYTTASRSTSSITIHNGFTIVLV